MRKFDLTAVDVAPVAAPVDGFLWAQASGTIPAHGWATLGILEFPLATKGHVVVAGAVGVQDFDGLSLWCPVVASGWLSIKDFAEACKGIAWTGPVAIWAKNEKDAPVQFDVRVRFQEGGQPPSAPDVTPAYYASRVWRDTRFHGVEVLKNPCDLWVMQEILHEVQPDLVIETGTFKGGSALFYACTLQGINNGRVVTIDVEDNADSGATGHGRIFRLSGSSVDPRVLRLVEEHVLESQEDKIHRGGPVLVVLDSDHSYDHVLAELRAYAPLVTPGSYLVVEDTNTPGPAHAVADFLASPEGARFEADRAREKFGTTFNPGGYLRKIKGGL